MNLSRQFLAAMLVATAFAGPAAAGTSALTKVGDLSESTRPHGVPLDYVVTPNGLFHPSCVVKVNDDERLAASGDVVRRDGSVASKASACTHPRYVARDGAVERIDPDAPAPTFDGWIASSNSNANVTPPAKKMVATFGVPSGPTTKSGQVLYYFPGLEDGTAVQTILQPVLAWNGFGDSRWTMTNWNCCKSGKTWHGSTIVVNTGDKIKGSMIGSNCANGVCSKWTLKSVDRTTGQSTTFLTESYGQAFDWYFGGAKEAYGVDRCSHYPANGSITFSNIHVYDLNGVETTPTTWNTFKSTSAPACNYGVSVTKNVTKITFNTSP
ncbi:MAG TPA: hypothetical protein VFY73_25885 [Ideonella sp.]|uniref:hypothetical protein n=1 Tax=Ideonella sp. TaxID=1929293 RepID=UPI002E37C799|nr:hypothetical protein [Ideonella sp.]HEX5687462.1 hypothetical protein [Ideonella sp.]